MLSVGVAGCRTVDVFKDGQLGVSARLPRPAPDHLGLDGLEECLDGGI